jgi:dGTPase
MRGCVTNKFYTSFDYETFGSRSRDKYRNGFQVDRDRVIHSYAFRRLQAKTQVFRPGEYDFYRTRLTHSIEVAQIGRSVCNFLLKTSRHLSDTFHIDPDLVEAVCLAHDIGHPPFGHVGERTLNQLMKNFGGFEANAQTLRLLTETIRPGRKPGNRRGMQPTRALLDGVLKYKQYRAQDQDKFIYDEQKRYLDFVFLNTGTVNPNWKSIECQIMDWADEVAYSVGDVIDGMRARIITADKLERWDSKFRVQSLVTELVHVIKENKHADFAGKKIGQFIEACTLVKVKQAPLSKQTNRHAFILEQDARRLNEQRCLAQIAFDILFQSPEVQQLEYKACAMLRVLFSVLIREYGNAAKPNWHLLKKEIEQMLAGAQSDCERARLLCDHLAGMSDEYAVRTYHRLRDPDFGSIVDLV